MRERDAANAYVPVGSMKVGSPAPILLPIPSSGIIPNAPTTLTYIVMPNDLVHGEIQSWNIALQRQLPHSFTLDGAYVGNHGVNDPVSLQINRGLVIAPGSPGPPLHPPFCRLTGPTSIIAL